jgi:AraC-like DNA-binding protein
MPRYNLSSFISMQRYIKYALADSRHMQKTELDVSYIGIVLFSVCIFPKRKEYDKKRDDLKSFFFFHHRIQEKKCNFAKRLTIKRPTSMEENHKSTNQMGPMTLLHAGHGIHHGDWNFPLVYSPFARLYYCDGGEAFTRVGNEVYQLKPGYMYLMPPFTEYSDWNTGYFSHYYMHVYPNQELGQWSIFEMMDIPIEVKASDFDLQCVKRIIEINNHITLPHPLSNPKVYDNQETLVGRLKSSAAQPLALTAETNGLLLILLAEFLRNAKSKKLSDDERIRNVIKFVRQNLDKNLSTRDLAKECFLSEDHFGRIFKKEMRCLPSDYVKKVKIEAAEVMLALHNTSIKDIAYSLAFDNPSYFNKVFKRVTGMTPSEYRKKLTY